MMGKASVRVDKKCQLGTIQYIHMVNLTSNLNKAVGPGPLSDALRNLGQAMFSIGIYLLSCQDKREDGTHRLSRNVGTELLLPTV